MRRMSSSRAWRFVAPRRRHMRSHAAIVSGEHRQFTGRAFGRRIVALEFMPGMVAAAGRTGYTPLGFSSLLFCDRRRVPTGGGYFHETQTLDSARSDPAALPAGPSRPQSGRARGPAPLPCPRSRLASGVLRRPPPSEAAALLSFPARALVALGSSASDLPGAGLHFLVGRRWRGGPRVGLARSRHGRCLSPPARHSVGASHHGGKTSE